MLKTLKDMLDSHVKIDNTLVWDGQTKPFFEAYQLKTNDPKGQWALWLRYSLLNPRKDKAVATLEGIYSSKNAPAIMVAETFGLAEYDIVHTDHFISIGDSYLSLAEAAGSIQDKKNFLKWEITLEDPVTSLRPFANDFLYHLPSPATKVVVPRLTCHATGQFYINHNKKEMRSQPLYQSHSFGTAMTRSWAWANCIGFKEDATACLEVLLINPPSDGKSSKRFSFTRPLCFIFLAFDDTTFFANSLWDALLLNKVELRGNEWKMSFKKMDYKFEIKLIRDPKLTNCVVYHGPNDESHFSELNLMASVEVKIHRLKLGAWHLLKTLTAANVGAFEVVSDD